MASADFSLTTHNRCPFRHESEISPGKNAVLHRTTARYTPLCLGHKGFAVTRRLALLHVASYRVFVHQPAVLFHTSSPRSVALTQLCFPSLAVASSREDFHLQDCAHAGRTSSPGPKGPGFSEADMKDHAASGICTSSAALWRRLGCTFTAMAPTAVSRMFLAAFTSAWSA